MSSEEQNAVLPIANETQNRDIIQQIPHSRQMTNNDAVYKDASDLTLSTPDRPTLVLISLTYFVPRNDLPHMQSVANYENFPRVWSNDWNVFDRNCKLTQNNNRQNPIA